ncbi:ParA family protein [Streptomyces sp. B1I3]|uniref:ParA family protein n=1 Tax=Streptomyces sp. B1I3 TaxID=3042264 RepID=UPI0027D79532|nr:AAA family ATPase [Streptomyces sp. B1I3]
MTTNQNSLTRIAFFNHKGGVSKTTSVFHVGWMLAERGHTVLMVDTDPQCNLTGMVMGFRGAGELEEFYRNHGDATVRSAVAPAFEGRPRPIEPVTTVKVPGREGLHLMAGDIRLAEYEVTLGIAQELSGSIQALQNVPGSLSYAIDVTANSIGADYVLIDMSPGLGAINQNLVGISDYVIVPVAPDFFSLMAIDSLSRVLPRWKKWASQASNMGILAEAAYPFPDRQVKVLGTIVQRFRPRAGKPASAFQRWINEIGQAFDSNLRPALLKTDQLLPAATYRAAGIGQDMALAYIADFNSLIGVSQERSTPVFALTEDQIPNVGVVLETNIESTERFHAEFSELALRIEKLVTAAEGNVIEALPPVVAPTEEPGA